MIKEGYRTRKAYRERIEELEEAEHSRDLELFTLRGKNWQLQKQINAMKENNRLRYEQWEALTNEFVVLLRRVIEERKTKQLKEDINEFIRRYSEEEDAESDSADSAADRSAD